jgi:hypothetical protein
MRANATIVTFRFPAVDFAAFDHVSPSVEPDRLEAQPVRMLNALVPSAMRSSGLVAPRTRRR